MRDITPEEQRIIKELIIWQSNGQSIKIGELLLKLYPIEYIEPSNKAEEFYKNTLDISYDNKNTSLSKILEAVNIIDLLIKKDYLVAKEFFTNNIIGEKNIDCSLLDMEHSSSKKHYVHTTLMNYYSYDLWNILNSYYYVTNSLVDFAKDFKTPEQRRHNCTTKISVAAIIVSVIIGIASPYISKCISEKSDKEGLEQVISAIKEQKYISIERFPNIIPDTLNIRVTDAPDKQPINLNVTVKENLPTKVQ